MLADPDVVIVDRFLGQLNAGGPPRTLFHVGSTITVTNPATGRHEPKRIIGILDSAFGFYGAGGGLYSPIIMSEAALRGMFGATVGISSALIKPAAGAGEAWLASRLQGQFLTHGLVATDIRKAVEDNFAANRGFFQLMQGFIALGLLVGIAGLGVMMVRAVRERRRSIGVLRALGFQARTVQRAFLTESLFVTLEGVVIGGALSIATTYMLFKNYEMFKTAGGGFSVPWLTIAALLAVATLASVVATIWPARQASKIQPAVAVRIAG
jgi:putative ABC transport system permease protein